MNNKTIAQEPSSEVDLTPMLDVVFILLIFFIVTTSFAKEKTLDVNLLPEHKPTESSISAMFTIDANNNISYENRIVSQNALRSLIAQKAAQQPDNLAVIVYANEASSVDTYVSILDAARQANVSSVGLKAYK